MSTGGPNQSRSQPPHQSPISSHPPHPLQYPTHSPHGYPSPSMSYNYPPPHHHASDPYGTPPSTSTMPLPSINLPPIHAVAPRQQQSHMQLGQVPSQAPLAPSIAQMGYYPPGMGHPQHPSMMAQPMQHPGMSFVAPGADNRIMSGGRHKKEIKRRTKTGCLTCRKRRIKCDELHPVCRNCTKSKRDCLGYDPIFKPATQPGGSGGLDTSQGSLQSSPSAFGGTQGNSSGSPTLGPNVVAQLREVAGAASPSMGARSPGGLAGGSYHKHGQPGLYQPGPASGASGAGQPPYAILPGQEHRNQALSADEASPSVSSITDGYEFPGAIDPALDGSLQRQGGGSASYSVHGPTSAPTYKRSRDDGSESPDSDKEDDGSKAKRIKINDLLSMTRRQRQQQGQHDHEQAQAQQSGLGVYAGSHEGSGGSPGSMMQTAAEHARHLQGLYALQQHHHQSAPQQGVQVGHGHNSPPLSADPRSASPHFLSSPVPAYTPPNLPPLPPPRSTSSPHTGQPTLQDPSHHLQRQAQTRPLSYTLPAVPPAELAALGTSQTPPDDPPLTPPGSDRSSTSPSKHSTLKDSLSPVETTVSMPPAAVATTTTTTTMTATATTGTVDSGGIAAIAAPTNPAPRPAAIVSAAQEPASSTGPFV